MKWSEFKSKVEEKLKEMEIDEDVDVSYIDIHNMDFERLEICGDKEEIAIY